MIGVLLTAVATFFEEISSSIGKVELRAHKESMYDYEILNVFFVALLFAGLALIPGNFVFRAASLPTFLLRIVLEILQTYMAALAVSRADRSTLGLLRVLTIPVILGIDLVLGTVITFNQGIGMAVVLLTIALLALTKELGRKGIWISVGVAVNAAFTISLFKYDVMHFNSIAAEQLVIYTIILGYGVLQARFLGHENPFALFKKRVFLSQGISEGVGAVLMSYAYALAPAASVLTSAKRSLTVLWSMLSGRMVFHERYDTIKLFGGAGLIAGVILLAR